jgi:hypothetical protein
MAVRTSSRLVSSVTVRCLVSALKVAPSRPATSARKKPEKARLVDRVGVQIDLPAHQREADDQRREEDRDEPRREDDAELADVVAAGLAPLDLLDGRGQDGARRRDIELALALGAREFDHLPPSGQRRMLARRQVFEVLEPLLDGRRQDGGRREARQQDFAALRVVPVRAVAVLRAAAARFRRHLLVERAKQRLRLFIDRLVVLQMKRVGLARLGRRDAGEARLQMRHALAQHRVVLDGPVLEDGVGVPDLEIAPQIGPHAHGSSPRIHDRSRKVNGVRAPVTVAKKRGGTKD